MNKKDWIISFTFFAIGIASRLPLIEKMQSHWDGPQYSIALIRYSLSQETPAPPGYPLYIAMGRLIYFFVEDPHRALLILSVIFAGLGCSIFYIVGKTLFNRSIGFISSLLFMSAPTFYFFGLTAYPYGLMPFISSLLALCSYLIIFKKKKIALILGFLFAFAFGVRPQEFPMLIPLFVLSLFYLTKNEKIAAIVSFVISSAIWILPFLEIVGGIQQYIQELHSFIRGGVQPFIFENSVFFISRMAKGMFLTFTIGLIFLLFYFKYYYSFSSKKKIKKILGNKYLQLFSVWIIPSFISNFLIRSDHAGYQMTYLSGILFLISYSIWKLNKEHKVRLITITSVIIVFNLFTFFRDRDPQNIKPYIPTSFHYWEIKKNDLRLGSKVNFIKNNFTSKTTLIITSSNLWRPITYHLPQYLTYEFDALNTTDSRFIFIKRESKGFNFKQYSSKNFEFIIPKNVNNVVFVDDNASNWVKNIEKKDYKLAGNSRLTSISVKDGDKFSYGLNSINFIK